MIRYRLRCDNGHDFDGWFRNSSAFDDQAAAGHVICPHCSSTAVEKALMTPNISGTKKSTPETAAYTANAGDDDTARQVRGLVRKLRDHVEKNSDYVGDKFAEEARKIHNEETEPRGIYGEASGEEVKDLKAEGVEFHPLPPRPDDKN